MSIRRAGLEFCQKGEQALNSVCKESRSRIMSKRRAGLELCQKGEQALNSVFKESRSRILSIRRALIIWEVMWSSRR